MDSNVGRGWRARAAYYTTWNIDFSLELGILKCRAWSWNIGFYILELGILDYRAWSWQYCIRIRRRWGIYGEIWPEPKGVPEGAARGNSRGFRPYFAVYPESSPNTDIISFLKVTLWPFSVLPSEVGLYWKSWFSECPSPGGQYYIVCSLGTIFCCMLPA